MYDMQDGLNHVHPQEFLTVMKEKDIVIIDIREPYELEYLPFDGPKNIPLNTLLNNYSDILKKDQEYYILCHHGQRSYFVTEVLHNKGYNVINVLGGIDLVNRFDTANK